MIARLTTKAWVLVADGGKSIILENRGDATTPRLEQLRTRELANPPAHEQGSDRPGRYHAGMSQSRSAVEATDFHAEAEKAFMAEVAGELDADLEAGRFKDLIVVVDPRALGHLRKAMSAKLNDHVRFEIAKDYTSETTEAIAKSVEKELAAS